MPFKTCPKCGKQSRIVDACCWNCQVPFDGGPAGVPFSTCPRCGKQSRVVEPCCWDLFAKGDESVSVRAGVGMEAPKTVVGRSSEQAAPAEIAKTHGDAGVRREAVSKLADEAALAEVAKTVDDYVATTAAIDKLEDQSLIAEVAKSAGNSVVRLYALRRITDQRLLADVACFAPWGKKFRTDGYEGPDGSRSVSREVHAEDAGEKAFARLQNERAVCVVAMNITFANCDRDGQPWLGKRVCHRRGATSFFRRRA